MGHQGPGHRDPLLLSTGQLVREGGPPVAELHLRQQ